jgi:uncharacterized protein (DUF58 family)
VSEAAPRDQEARKLLSAEEVFQLASMELRARAIAEGVLVGQHKSKAFGASTEFKEHKEYAPGDDIRALDWRAYARRDRHMVRRYEAERNLEVILVVDTSGSMGYAGGAGGKFGASKLDYAATLAAGLAWLAGRRSDAPALTLFAAKEKLHLPPRARQDHLMGLLAALERAQSGGVTDLTGALEQTALRQKRNALIVVFTDLLDVGDEFLSPLGALRKRGADVLLVHTLHRDELEFPFDGVVRFEDMEEEREVQVDAPGVRRAYLDEIARFLEESARGAARRDLRYVLAPTDAPPSEVLREALYA